MRNHFSIIAVVLAGCVGQIGGGDDGSGSGSGTPVTCDQARTYTNLGGEALEAGRATIAAGSDRIRVKPYGALADEYARALGLASVDTSAFAATFGKPPARWFNEPKASANTIYAAFALAYAACTLETSDPYYATAPSAALADTICRSHARRAWHREPTDDEAAACATYAVDKTDPADAPNKRWAYACAAVLTASGFLAY